VYYVERHPYRSDFLSRAPWPRRLGLFAFHLAPSSSRLNWTTGTFSKLLSPNGISRSWRQTCAARKLPRVQFHALRHTHASTLIRAGVDVLTISRRLGHSSASMTLDVYGHLMEGADAAAAKAIEGMLK
jgi:integrase